MDECIKERVFIYSDLPKNDIKYINIVRKLKKKGFNVMNSCVDSSIDMCIADYFYLVKPYDEKYIYDILKETGKNKLLSRKLC